MTTSPTSDAQAANGRIDAVEGLGEGFVHLHTHTEFSRLDGLARVKDLGKKIASDGQTAGAMTDHGTIGGAYKFNAAMKAAGVKPIFGCLLKGQEIVTATGIKNVEDVQVGDDVLTHKGRMRRVLSTMARPYEGRAYNIHLAGRYGRTLTLTEEHPILIRTHDGRVDWVKPGEIAAGRRGRRGGKNDWNSWVCLPRLVEEPQYINLSDVLDDSEGWDTTGEFVRRSYASKFRADQTWNVPTTIEVDADLAYLMGVYAAEGHVVSRAGALTGAVSMTHHVRESHVWGRVASTAAKFGATHRLYRRGREGSENTVEPQFASLPIAYLLAHCVGRGAANKRVPKEVLNAPREVRMAFIQGLIDGDGRTPGLTSNPSNKCDLRVTSRDLAWGFRTLIASEGHFVGITRSERGSGRHDIFTVTYSPDRAWSRTLEDENYVYRPIADVVELHLEDDVFNFEVEEDNSYVSDFILHNCEAYLALVPEGADAFDPTNRFQNFEIEVEDGYDGSKKKRYEHLTILARNRTGWHNLVAMSNDAQDSYWYYPRIDYALLETYGRRRIDGTLGEPGDGGLIVLSGCLAGPVAGPVMRGRMEQRNIDEQWLRSRAQVEALDAAFRANPDLDDDGANAVAEQAIADLVLPDADTVAACQARAEEWFDQARAGLDWLIRCVGHENVYVEVMEHDLDIEGWDHIVTLAKLAKEKGLPVVATNDCHYTEDHHCDAHDAWLAVESTSGKPARLDDPNRFRFNGHGYHVRTAAEMRALYPDKAGWQKACDETLRIAARCDADVMPEPKMRLPKFPVPEDFTPSEKDARMVSSGELSLAGAYLKHLIREGASNRFGLPLPKEAVSRLNFEMSVISPAGLDDYFLFVRDVIDWARSDRGMPTPAHPLGEPGRKKPIRVGPGRGSAAGSLVSYCIGIVNVDPLRYNLLFERFLNPERAGMPDIDVDFEANRRDEVIRYLVARWGRDKVAKIGSFSVSLSRRALRDAARLLDLSALGDKLSKAVPIDAGKPLGFDALYDPANTIAADFRALAESKDAQSIVDLATKWEGVANGEGIHACGILVSDEPMHDLVPLRKDRSKGATDDDPLVTRWDGKDVDAYGLLKMDILSIENLDFVAQCVENIKATTGEDVDPDNLPDPDHPQPGLEAERVAKTWALLKAGKTAGVFQLESAGMTRLCEQVQPENLDDLSALVALYRPGPLGQGMDQHYANRKHGREPVDYGIFTADPAEQDAIASVLGETHGVVTYQEQLMRLGLVVGGLDAGMRNKLQKAFSKKIREQMEEVGAAFREGGQQTMTLPDGTEKVAFAAETLDTLWETFRASADYLFNKSHSTAYGYLAYVTAYLKANWPVEYGAAILSVTDKSEKRRAALAALASEGIEVLPPDVNLSAAVTMPDPADPHAVRLGLSEIRDVGSQGRWVVEERERKGGPGKFTSLADLMERVKVPDADGHLTARIGLTALEGMLEAGALDSFGPRLGLALALRALGSNPDTEILDVDWGLLERSARQRLRLGLSIGEHPLKAFRDHLREWSPPLDDDRADVPTPVALHRIAGSGRRSGNILTLGLLTAWSERPGRNGRFANFTVEGTQTVMDGVVWADSLSRMSKNGTVPQIGQIVCISGYAKSREIITGQDEDGNDVIEERAELTASEMWIVDVPDAAGTIHPVTPPLRLAEVLPLARERAATPKPSARAKKPSTSTVTSISSRTPASGSAPTDEGLSEDPTLIDGTAPDQPVSVPTILPTAKPGEPTKVLWVDSLGVPSSAVRVWGTASFRDNRVQFKVLQDQFPALDPNQGGPKPLSLPEGTVFRVQGGCLGCANCRCSRGDAHEAPQPCDPDCPECAVRQARASEFVVVVKTADESAVEGYLARAAALGWEGQPSKHQGWSVVGAARVDGPDDGREGGRTSAA